MKVKSLESKIDDLQIYIIKSNLVFYNIPKEATEDPYSVVAFMINNLQINTCCTPEGTLGAEIRIDVCHRCSQRKGSARPLIVKFVTQKGRDMIIDHVKKIKGNPICYE